MLKYEYKQYNVKSMLKYNRYKNNYIKIRL